MLHRLGVVPVRIRSVVDLKRVEALILPGGESTTMLRLIHSAGLFAPLQDFARSFPTWGICAGAILIAKEVCSPTQESLALMDIRATRNFYGSQCDSFKTMLRIPSLHPRSESPSTCVDPVGATVEVDFIRAPMLEPLPSRELNSEVETLASHDGRSVLLKQGHLLASAFHTELGDNPVVHEFFLSLRTENRAQTADTPMTALLPRVA